MSWNVDLGYQNQIYNWYGLPSEFGNSLSDNDRSNLINSIDPQHTYNNFSAGGKIAFTEGVLSKASVKFNHFSDSFGSVENRFYVKPTVQFDVFDQFIKTNFIVDYVGGSFDNNYTNNNLTDLKYGYTNVGVEPSFVVQQDDWTLNIGAGLYYSMDKENSDNQFFVYPQINASYKVVGDLMIFYAGAEGGLQQNSYSDFANQNTFLSPTLAIRPTDKQYDVFAGLKGRLTNNVSYNVKGSYKNERNKALFKSNDYSENATNSEYGFGNSFQVVYDDMRTLSLTGDLKAAFSENVSVGIGGTFNSYTNDIQQEAWNLPRFSLMQTLISQ